MAAYYVEQRIDLLTRDQVLVRLRLYCCYTLINFTRAPTSEVIGIKSSISDGLQDRMLYEMLHVLVLYVIAKSVTQLLMSHTVCTRYHGTMATTKH